jgi:hypothetical protein
MSSNASARGRPSSIEQGERPLLVTNQLLERPVQAEAGLHADRHHVQRVWQHGLELRPPLTHQLVEPNHGEVEPDRHTDEEGDTDRE